MSKKAFSEKLGIETDEEKKVQCPLWYFYIYIGVYKW